MIEIRSLTGIGLDILRELNTGYVTSDYYRVQKSESPDCITFSLAPQHLPAPIQKRWKSTEDDLERYQQVAKTGFSLGAYQDRRQVGIAIAEVRRWNRTLWIWEFYVSEKHRRLGVGSQLMGALAVLAEQAGMRIMTAETQSTNTPAIAFYLAVGFEIEAIDLSYYTNQDIENGEVAIFMKRKLE